jgi:protein-histidine N-methyltransferase
MAESSATNDNEALIANLSSSDLSSGTYEGGFKTWECAIDLGSLLSTPHFTSFLSAEPNLPIHVIELGAGSAIPSLAVLQQALSLAQSTSRSNLHLTFCDYNIDVLKLCTAPNILLNYHLHTTSALGPASQSNQDLDLDLEPIASTLPHVSSSLSNVGINISLVSGAWGSDFYSLLKPMLVPESTPSSLSSFTPPFVLQQPPKLLILASETIYSPDALPDFVGTLIGLLSLGTAGSSRALVAAKKVYFGVGGGVAEFEREVQARGAVVRRVWDSGDDGGVGRVVLEVTLES